MKNYELLDSGNLRKLEQCGDFRLIRPALNAFWKPLAAQDQWAAADAEFVRDSGGGGRWMMHSKLPAQWQMKWGEFELIVKPTPFGHLGFFAEQYANWDFFRKTVPLLGKEAKTLNLFGYSGLGSMAMAEGGASVCHLDASKGMIDWGRAMREENAARVPDRIRWIADDVMKFCNRELRRGSRYNGIALDPPSFGRGTSGQVWKIEEDLPKLLRLCRELLDISKPFFVVLSGHSAGFSPLVQENLLREVFGSAVRMESMEMTVPEHTGRVLPAGICTRLLKGF